MMSCARSVLVASLFAALLAGCGGGHDALEKQVEDLRAEVGKLRAKQASMAERLDAIDIDRGAFAKGAASAAAAAPPGSAGPSAPVAPPPAQPSDRPALETVKLSPNEGDGDADNDPSRPVVRATGDGSSARQTLSNRNISSRPRKGSPKKTDSGADARPVVKP